MEPNAEAQPPPQPGRRWAPAIGLLALGLAVAGIASAPGLQGDPGPTLRALGTIGYLAGVAIAGFGIHRMLWSPASPRPRAVRILVTAIVTYPAFVVAGIALGLLMTLIQLRSPF